MNDDERRARDDALFKLTLRRRGYWTVPRVVAAVLVAAAILLIALQLF